MKITLSRTLTAAIFMSLAAPALFGEGWTTDYAKAVAEAKTDDKAVLLNFTGSDWCVWCAKMKREALDTGTFRDYAEKNLVLVEVDFPQFKPQPDQVKEQNQKLSRKYKVTGYPTFVLLNKNGKVLGRQDGYLAGGAAAFVDKMRRFYKAPPRSGDGGGDDFDSLFSKPAQGPTQ
jgi:thioredoxin-related protein